MPEEEIISQSPEPRTVGSLSEDLRRIGVSSGMTLLVHGSLSALGWVNGGPVAVIQALMDALTSQGTLIMPTHSGGLSDPAKWENPPVPAEWWEPIRQTMPAYDADITPTSGMGVIPETFRKWPGVQRSVHPTDSFAAWGHHAEEITRDHQLEFGLGEGSPLARIYELDGWVLLIGVGHANNTSFHLAEYRLPFRKTEWKHAPIETSSGRTWQQYEDIELNEELFDRLGADFEQREKVQIGQIGSATSRLFRQRPAVDFAVRWFTDHHKDAQMDPVEES